ncbi:hypothetical protein [Candidatus Enterococcus ferrettii]|uniref:Uncharacterized protein n=1 Tax=Candidatus Enterococcus ferrettii TaxID=2815324 RepID=A0ABV0ENZ9_9ENTE|nr:hypothetical protein [Enterococcus sp. 665A]MBO1340896.1 hypothetical protein [Enterococcus sp. 665A]
MYDDETAIQLFLEAKSVYEDRNMMKWNTGFFLSEHTSLLKKDRKQQAKVVLQKIRMDSDDIDRTLFTARQNNQPVAIQLEQLDENGQYQPDIIGMIYGHDELGIYVGNQKVGYDEIRNVEITTIKKWNELERSEYE